MFLKLFAIVFVMASFVSNASGITRLNRIGTFYSQDEFVKGLATCKDKSGNIIQLRLSTVEYIIILQKKDIEYCHFNPL